MSAAKRVSLEEALRWAWEQETPQPWDRYVLLALLSFRNHRTGDIFPSAATLAARTGLERKRILSSIARLEAEQIITDTGRRVGKTGLVRVFRLVMQPERAQQAIDRSRTETVPRRDRCTEPKQSLRGIVSTVETVPPQPLFEQSKTVPPRDTEQGYISKGSTSPRRGRAKRQQVRRRALAAAVPSAAPVASEASLASGRADARPRPASVLPEPARVPPVRRPSTAIEMKMAARVARHAPADQALAARLQPIDWTGWGDDDV